MSASGSVNSSILAHPRVIAWRNRLRSNSMLRSVYRIWVGRRDYEERFARGLLAAVTAGDVVWDIGANVGHYTTQFLRRQAGQVVCFEPAPEAVRVLRERFGAGAATDDRVHIVPAALSNERGTVRFAADGAAPTNRIADSVVTGATLEVPVLRGDQALADYQLPAPQVIKIDVEGYELEVIQGLSTVLALASLRAVFIEVHFALLHARGLDRAPSQIVATLNSQGFRVSWLDPSHLSAVRARPSR